MNKDLLTIQEAANILGVSTKSLRRWDKADILIPARTKGNQRRYAKEQIITFKNRKSLPFAYPSALSDRNVILNSFQDLSRTEMPNQAQPDRHDSKHIPNIFKVSPPAFAFGKSRWRAGAFVFGLAILVGLLAFSLLGKMGKGELVLAVREYFLGPRDVILNSFQDLGSNEIPKQSMKQVQDMVRNDKTTGGSVLAESTIDNTLLFNVNIPSAFNDSADFLEGLHAVKIATLSGGIITEDQDIDAGTGALTASNVLYGATAGTGISIGTGQNPTITNSDLGSSQNIFKTIKVGSSSFSSGSNTDTLELAAGSNITLSADTSNKKVTITGSSSTASGWTDDGTVVRLSTSTDSVGIGTTSPLAALDVAGAATVSGNLNLYGAARSIQTTSNNTLTIGGSTTGNLIFSPLNGSGTLRITSLTSCDTIDTDGNGLLSCGTDTGGSGSTNWRLASGALSPINDTLDLLIGNAATTSAKFAVLNINSGTPTASVSANSTNNATFLTGLGNLATTNMQTLTLGGSTTGNVTIDAGVGNITLSDSLTLSGTTITGSSLTTITGAATAIDFTEFDVSATTGSVTINDGGDAGNINIESTILDINSLDFVAAGSITTGGTGDLTLDAGGSNILLSDALNAGGAAAAAYNFFASDITGVSTPEGIADLYVQDELEVDGTIRFNNLTYTFPSSETAGFILQTNGTGTLSWANPASSTGFWSQTLGALYPNNSTVDILVGAQATASAKFAVLNINSGNPTASVSAQTGNQAVYIDSTGTIATTAMDGLTIGGSTTGNITLDAGSGTITLSDDTTVSGDLAVNGATSADITSTTTTATLFNATVTTLSLGGAATTLNLADSTATKTIDIGGVTSSGTDTINISTEGTASDTIAIGNTNASTTLAFTGGDDWTMSGTGVLTLSASAAQTTAIVVTDTDYTNAISLGDNVILGTTAAIDFTEFDVSATTGSVTINDGGDAGNINIESTVLDINSLDFVAAGLITTGGTGDLTLDAGGSNILLSDALNAGGAAAAAYNYFASDITGVSTPEGIADLYIQDELEADGTIRFNNVTYTFPSADGSSNFILTTNGTGTLSWQAISGVDTANYWRTSLGAISPINDTFDVLVGNAATTSAKFAVLNINSGTPTASVSANSGNNATYLTGDGTLATTNRGSLTIGNSSTYNTTGNVLVNSNGTGNVGIGTATPTQLLSLSEVHLFSTTGGGSVVFNETGADIDFRIESDTSANLFTLDSGLFSGVGQVSFGAAAQVTATAFVVIDNPDINATTNQPFAKVIIDNTNTVTVPTGTASIVTSLFVDEPNIIANGTVTVGASLYIQAAPTEGTNNYSLFVDAGTFRFDSGGVINEDGNDSDFRIESDTNANMVVLDSGLFAGVGQLSFGAASQVTPTGFMVIDNPNITATAGQPFSKVAIDNTRTVTVPTGTASIVASLFVDEPNIIATGTVTNAATLYMQAAPTEGTNNYALWVDAGASRFDGAVTYGSQATFTDSDATPNVSAGSHFITNTTAVTITDFDAGAGTLQAGHVIYVESNGVITYDVTASGLNGGTTDIVTGAGDTTTWIYNGTDWNLISWMDDSVAQTGADIAELFPSVEALEPGDLVAADAGYPVHVKKSSTKYERQLLGIVSTQPGIILQDSSTPEGTTYPVALAGRVPVKVSIENGSIATGDYLTSSSTPGIAMKSTRAGQIIGKALEPFDSDGIGTVMVFVNLSWYDPSVYIAMDGNLSNGILPISNTTNNVIETSDQTSNSQLSTLNSQLQSDPLFKDLSDKVSLLDTKINNLAETAFSASTSAILSSDVIPEIYSGQALNSFQDLDSDLRQNDKDATISGTLMVLGRATVSDLGVTGNINSGILSINGLGGEIYTLAGDLKLQSLGLGGIDILAGKVTIDTKGNLEVKGTVTAKTLEGEEFRVLGAKTIGTATIAPSQKFVEVATPAANNNSKIFITPTTLTNKQLAVTYKTDGRFKVEIQEADNTPITFDWWIVN